MRSLSLYPQPGMMLWYSMLGKQLHEECRNEYTKPSNIAKYLREQHTSPAQLEPRTPQLRSKDNFNFQEDCLFVAMPHLHKIGKGPMMLGLYALMISISHLETFVLTEMISGLTKFSHA